MKNNTSFDEKRHVVWWKTTRRLMKNITSFKKEQVLAYPTRPTRVRATSALPFIQQMWNSSGISLSTRARKQEFYHFCCHKCHRLLPIFLCSTTLQPILRYILTDKWFKHSKSAYHNNEKHTFRPFLLRLFFIFFSSFSLLVWHLWQQKNEIAVRMRARVRVLRAGAKTSAFSTDFFASLFRQVFPSGFFELIFRVNLSLRFPWSQTKHTPEHRIMLHRYNKSNTSHNKFFTFPQFFPSLEQFRPIYL